MKWKGKVEVNGVSAEVTFEVFDSSGRWDFLFGKTLLERFQAVHDYKLDEITLHGTEGRTTLHNQIRVQTGFQQQPTHPSPIRIITDETQPNEDEDLTEVDVRRPWELSRTTPNCS